jgi:nitrate reductase beta subunit
VLLYDADRILEAASAPSDQEVYPAHLGILLDPEDPEIQKAAAAQGIADSILSAATRSPVYRLIKKWKLALPLHPEFRTLPMVWYIPPLSPVKHHTESIQEQDFIDNLRIPVTYLANLLTAGDQAPVRLALKRLSAVRRFMRSQRIENKVDREVSESVGLSEKTIEEIFRLLSLARLEDRTVLPRAPVKGDNLFDSRGTCGFGDSI